MNFFTPLGFIALLAIPIIIIMYLLKQKYNEVKIPSLFLWNKAVEQSKSHKPWQKLKKNLLMFLQILSAILFAFALSNPFVFSNEKTESYIFVLDASLSMQATDDKPTRFESAKATINKMISESAPNVNFTIIVLDSNPYIALNQSGDKTIAQVKLSEIEVTNGSVDIESAILLIKLQKEQTKGNVYVFTDSSYEYEDIAVNVIPYGNSNFNCAVSYVSHSQGEDGYNVLVRIKNYYNETVKRTVTLYSDNNIFDYKDIIIDQNSSQDIIFEGIGFDSSVLMAKIDKSDILETDDYYYYVINNFSMKKVIMVAEKNIFIEKILAILPNIELYKTGEDNMEGLSGYDLYVFDGVLPSELPNDGHILAFNPQGNENFIQTGGSVDINSNVKASGELIEPFDQIEFAVSKAMKVSIPTWATTHIVSSDNTPLLLTGEKDNQKIGIFTFDLHDSDLPLKKEYPVFMYNIVNWLFPNSVHNLEQVYAGNTVEFNVMPKTNNVSLTTPKGEEFTLAPPFPISPFTQTGEVGIYVLSQEDENGENLFGNFAVNPNIIGESELNVIDREDTIVVKNEGISAGRSLRNSIIIILLLVIAVEWWVNSRDN